VAPILVPGRPGGGLPARSLSTAVGAPLQWR